MRVPVDRADGRVVRHLMTFFCPRCRKPLEQTGQADRFMCAPCRKMYEVRIELRELERILDDGHSRKPELPEADLGGDEG